MKNYIKEIQENILTVHRYSKRTIAILTDIGLCILCIWLAFIIRLEELILFKDFNFYPIIISVLIAIPIFWLFGLYQTIFRYTNLSIITTVLTSTFVYGLLFFLIIGAHGITGVPRSIGLLQPMLLFFAILSSRLLVKFFLTDFSINFKRRNKKKNVIIYGAGDAGQQLVIALENNPEFKVVGVIDDNRELQGQFLFGQKIYSQEYLSTLIETKNVDLAFLAMTAINRSQRGKIIEKLNQYKLIVKTLPSISEIVDGRVTISDIKDLNIDDLLNREQVEPDIDLLNKKINSKTVLVTGAGGSIGSELCRQIIKLKPSKLLLVELNEFALYKIFEELKSFNKDLKIISLLANTQDQLKLEKIFETFKVDTIYHVAAYKHVPLVEENICEGIRNNVFSTLAVAKASVNKNVNNLVLVSSDKAVRPTNIMGATKRLSELCMQGIYSINKNKDINFSIVRFGNVLESSGSVIPKFKKQIKDGGPVTLTHKDVSRYFMTITEAAQLVIQAGAMGKNSEVFILDMGESVKIKDLITKMINLSGFEVKDDKNLKGDIEIEIIGLRPGEKLYEELLLGVNPQRTNHPKIQMASDPFIPFNKLEISLNNLKSILDSNKAMEAKKVLEEILELYKSNSKIVDHYHAEQKWLNKKKNDLSLKKIQNNVVKFK
jgi:FlaA1/EpsC-like NDP-sugar epimerase